MDQRLAARAIGVPFTHRRPRVDRERHHKLQQLRLAGREPFPDVHLRSRSLAATIYASHDPRTLDTGEHRLWRYVVAGRLIARRKHRHATFFDLRDQSGIIELCARRDQPDELECSQLLNADIGDIVTAEGTVYVTDNHRLALSVLTSRLLTKALRSPPARTNAVTTTDTRSRQGELDLLANEQARTLLRTRSTITEAIREWMKLNLFIEVEGPTSRLYLRRCLLSGLERVYELGRCLSNVDGSQWRGRDATMLEWSTAYIDYKEAARQVEQLIVHAAASIAPETRVLWHDSSIDLGGPWRSTTVREGIREQSGLDILTADSLAIARHLPSGTCTGDTCWSSQVNQLYATLLEPKLIQPTIVYDFPLDGRVLVKRHPAHDALAGDFRVVIGGIEVASGDSELNDPQEVRTRLSTQERFASRDAPGGNGPPPALPDDEVRLLEYGLCPAASARLQVDRLVMLLTGSDTVDDVIPLPLLKGRS